MGSRESLGRAKARKNNEFYTPSSLVEVGVARTLADNPGLFRGRTLLLPCDDPDWSEFTRYFIDNFELLGLARLISTCYEQGGQGRYLDLRDDGSMVTGPLEGSGDFRSEEVTNLRDGVDLIITNPPFEHMLEFITWLVDGDVDFVFIGPNTLPTTKVFRDAYLAGLVRPVQGTCASVTFRNPYGNPVKAAATWYTNLSTSPVPVVPVDPEEGLASAGKRGAWKQYHPYDNVAARECGRLSTIPQGYSRPLGVPVSYVSKEHGDYCAIDLINNSSDSPNQKLTTEGISVDGRNLFCRALIIKRDTTTVNDVKELPTWVE